MRYSSYIDQTIRDRYEVRQLLGEGGMGQVFRVWDRQARRECALKLIDTRNKKFPLETVLRFRSEAETLQSLRHAGIVRYIDYFDEDEMHALLMEYVPGTTLRELIDREGALPHDMALRLLRALSEALLYLHEQGLVHHDLKSSNIQIVAAQGSDDAKLDLRVLDFGLSHLVGARERHLAGTLAYMAPEQTGMLNKLVDHRADLYALGVVLYEALTGQLPFMDSDPAILMHQHVAATPRRPSELVPDVPPVLERITLKLLSKDPEDRYRTAAGLIRDLDRLTREAEAAGQGIQSVPVFAPGEADHWDSFPRRNPFLDRERERSQFLKLLERVSETGGPGKMILLDGTRGIGKTELLNTLYNEVKPQPGVVWFYTPRSAESELRHKTLRELLGNFVTFLGTVGEERQREIVSRVRAHFQERFETFLDLVPALRDWLADLQDDDEGNASAADSDSGAAGDPAAVSFEFMQTVARHEKRLVVFIDDFHNVEISSARALLEGFAGVREFPIVFIFAYNHELLGERQHEILRRLRDSESVHFSRLEALSEAVCGDLLQQLFSRKLGDLSALLAPLYAATGGNPGTLRTILETLIDRKVIYFENGNWQTKLDEALATIQNCGTIDAQGLRITREAQLAGFSEPELDLLRRSAVFQRAFTLDALEAILAKAGDAGDCLDEAGSASLPGPEITSCNHRVIEMLDRAVNAGVLSVDSNRLYAFREPALRMALRDQLPDKARRALHSRIARFIEAVVLPDSPDAIYDVAHHQEHAGDLVAALDTYERAAEQSFHPNFVDRQAQLYYDLAYRIVERLPAGGIDDERRFVILYRAVSHDINLNPTRAVLSDRLEALERLAGDNTAWRIQYLTARSLHCFYHGRKDEMLRYSEELFRIGDSPEYAELTLQMYLMVGTTPTGKSFKERAELLKKGIAIAMDLQRAELIPPAVTVYMNMLAYLGRFEEARNTLEKIVAKLNEQNSPMAPIVPIFARGVLHGESGEFGQLLREQSDVNIAELPIPEVARTFVRTHQARAMAMEGRFQEALQFYSQLIDRNEDTANRTEFAMVMHGRILLALRMEELEAALEYVERGLRHLRLRPDPYLEALFHIHGAQAYLQLGQTHDAADHVRASREIARGLDSQLLDAHLEFVTARLNWQQSRDENYIAAGEAVLEHFRDMQVTGYYNIYREDLKQWRNLYSDSSSHTIMGGGENRELIRLMEINRKISSTLDTNVLLEEVLKGAMQIAGARHGYLFTCEDLEESENDRGASTPLPRLQISHTTTGEAIPVEEQLISRTILHTTITSRAAIVTREARREKRWDVSKSVMEKNLRSILSVPILLRDRILGVLYLDNQQASSVFTIKDREIVENFATQVAIAMNNARIFQAEQEARARTEAMLQTFSRFVPRQFTERFADGNVELLQTGLSRQESLSILFSDVRSFTSLSEALGSEGTFVLLNEYLDRMETPIRSHDGFVDKFIGDAIMALFDGDHSATSAVNAGLAMLNILREFNQDRAAQGLSELRTGIGINTGDAMIGVVGSRERMDTTVMGDTVNTASRIESLTKYYGCDLLIGEATHRALTESHSNHGQSNGSASKTAYRTRFVDRVQVKGKDESTRVYEVFNHDSAELRDKKQKFQPLFAEAQALYQSADWAGATQLFGEYYAKFPEDRLVIPFLERCERFQTLPPEDWVGIYRLDTK